MQVGAGEKEGNATLLIKNSGSSIIFNKSNKYKNVINIKIKTLANICRTYIPKKKQIEFCKIDVERFEKYVLLGFDFDSYRPKVFCIESLINKKTHKPEYLEWENILFKNNYDFAYNFRRNRYYYDKRIPELKEKFKSIDFYINKYINKFWNLNNLKYELNHKYDYYKINFKRLNFIYNILFIIKKII